jgi:hypothetical protein
VTRGARIDALKSLCAALRVSERQVREARTRLVRAGADAEEIEEIENLLGRIQIEIIDHECALRQAREEEG